MLPSWPPASGSVRHQAPPRRASLGLIAAIALLAALPGPASATSVRVVACPTTYGIAGARKPLPTKVVSHLSPAAAGGLVFYANALQLVLAPGGWHCAGQVGADGSSGMMITRGREAIGVLAVGYASEVGAAEACALFADAAPPAPCPEHPPAAEKVVRVNTTTVAFEDPPRVHGTGVPSGGSLPANGVMRFNPAARRGYFFEETCVLPVAEHARCTELLDDGQRRAPR